MAAPAPTRVLTRSNERRWVGILATFGGWLVGTYVATMLLWVVVSSLLFGWQPMVVVSDSMRPLIRAGDVVLFEEPQTMVGPGTVIAFQSADDIVVHRVLALEGSDGYVTKGDANRVPDSAVVAPDQVVGQGRLLVPYIGLAKVAGWGWWVAVGVLVVAAIPAWRLGTGASVGVTLALLTLIGATAAWAVLSATTANTASMVSAVEVAPPTNLTASCGLIGAGNVQVNLSWNPSPTPGITGFRILYDAPGGGTDYTPVGTVGPTATTFTHAINVALLGLGTHTYIVQTLLGTWESEPSNPDSVTITQVLFTYLCA